MWYSAVGSLVALILSLLAVPRAAAAPPAGKVWRIGYLNAGSGRIVEGFQQGLRDLGYVEGQNIVIEYRQADHQLDRLADLSAELARLPVDIIVTEGENAARAVQHATRTIPIVLAAGSDPVGLGLIASLARPGGNVTGIATLAPETYPKRLALLKEALPGVTRVAVLRGLERFLGAVVELVQPRQGVVFEAELADAHHPDDHVVSCSSSFGWPPPASSPLSRARSASTWLCAET